MAQGWWYTKAFLASAPLCAMYVCVCAMHPLYLWVPCMSLRPTQPFAFVFLKVFLSFRDSFRVPFYFQETVCFCTYEAKVIGMFTECHCKAEKDMKKIPEF